MSLFLGCSLLFSFNQTSALQTKYLPWITGAASIVAGIIGYNWNSKSDDERNPERATRSYRIWRALLAAAAAGGVTYGIAYLFTPWGLKWLAGIYLGDKLQHPIVKGKMPKTLQDVEDAYSSVAHSVIHDDHSHIRMSDNLAWLNNGLSKARNNFEGAIYYADKNDPKEVELAQTCSKQIKKIDPAIKKTNTTQSLVKNSKVYHRELNARHQKRRDDIERSKSWAAHRKADASYENARAMRERNNIERTKLDQEWY